MKTKGKFLIRANVITAAGVGPGQRVNGPGASIQSSPSLGLSFLPRMGIAAHPRSETVSIPTFLIPPSPIPISSIPPSPHPPSPYPHILHPSALQPHMLYLCLPSPFIPSLHLCILHPHIPHPFILHPPIPLSPISTPSIPPSPHPPLPPRTPGPHWAALGHIGPYWAVLGRSGAAVRGGAAGGRQRAAAGRGCRDRTGHRAGMGGGGEVDLGCCGVGGGCRVWGMDGAGLGW